MFTHALPDKVGGALKNGIIMCGEEGYREKEVAGCCPGGGMPVVGGLRIDSLFYGGGYRCECHNRWKCPDCAVPEGGGDPVPFADVIGVMPGAEVSKVVEVENTGDKDAYVRIRLDKELTLMEDAAGETDLSLIGLNIDTENWTEKDGWYYYGRVLKTGETTEPLFTSVAFSKDMGDVYQNGRVKIAVHASAVQADNNGDSAREAAGWPEE